MAGRAVDPDQSWLCHHREDRVTSCPRTEAIAESVQAQNPKQSDDHVPNHLHLHTTASRRAPLSHIQGDQMRRL